MTDALGLLMSTSGQWWAWMVPMTWQVLVLAAAVGLVTLIASRASPHLRYWLWFLVLVKLCLPPSLAFVTGLGTVASTPRYFLTASPEIPSSVAPIAAVTQVTAPSATPLPPPRIVIPAHAWFFLAWLAGMAVVLGLLLVQYRRMAVRLRTAEVVTDPQVLQLLGECCTLIGVRRPVPMVVVDALSPVLFGALHPRIALPRSVTANLARDELKPILLHELAHLKRHDLWLNWVQFAVQAVYWFNPVVYLAGWCMRRERELIADDRVLACVGGARENYSSSLLHVVKQGQQRYRMAPGLVGIGEDGAEVKQRVKRIMDSRRRLYVRLGVASAVAVVIAALVLIPQARGKGWPFMKDDGGKIVFDIPRLDKITVDGKADDWGDRGFRGSLVGVRDGKLMSRGDLDVSFRLGWTSEGLAVLITTHSNRFTETPDIFGGHCIEMFIADSVGGHNQVQVVASPGVTPEQPELRQRIFDYMRPQALRDKVPATAKVVRAREEQGYAMEVLLPWNMIDVTPTEGREVGFQFYVNQPDSSGAVGRALWYPVHGTHANSNLAQVLRLSSRPSDPYECFAAVKKETVSLDQLQWTVLCDKRYSGRTVSIRSGGKTLAKGILHDAGAVASAVCTVAPATGAEQGGLAQVMVDGKVAATAVWTSRRDLIGDLKPQISWLPTGKPSWHAAWINGLVRGLELILRRAGRDVDYVTMMGDVGQAFIAQGEENSANTIDGAVDVGWWPLEPLCAVRLNFLERTVGQQIRDVKVPARDIEGMRKDRMAYYKKHFEPVILSSLNNQTPCVGHSSSDMFIVTGSDDADHPLMGMCPNTLEGEESISRLDVPLPPYVLWTIGGPVPAISREQADTEALRYAIALHRDQVLGAGAQFSDAYPLRHAEDYKGYRTQWCTGQRSFASWIACLEDTSHLGPSYWHNNVRSQLESNRGTAVRYLRDMQKRHPGDFAAYLENAVTKYEAVIAATRSADIRDAAIKTKQGRQKLIAAISEMANLEDQAVAELEKALATQK